MNYGEALAWLDRTQQFGIKLGLENTRRLLAAAGDPHERLRFLHVAGTNGKGSTCAMLDAMLRGGGMRCGLYTSPHLVDFRERIRIDNVMIPPAAAAEGLSLLRDASEGWPHPPTYFELATVLAAWWFDRAGAEVVVWETGMGGRLDATNVVTPRVSVITPIGLDHQRWLGGTLAAIAGEKAGIFKPGVPAVSAPQTEEVRDVLRARADATGAPLHFVEAPWDGPAPSLPGEHQRWNAALAVAALDAAGLLGQADARALAGVAWPARFQRVGSDLVIDGAHNPSAVATLVDTWREEFGERRSRLVFGVMRDKDAAELLRLLRAVADEVWLVPVANDRSADPADLLALARAAGFTSVRIASVPAALDQARSAGGPVLVAGSLFLAGEVLALVSAGSAGPLPAVTGALAGDRCAP